MNETEHGGVLVEIRDLLKEQNRLIADIKQMNEETTRSNRLHSEALTSKLEAARRASDAEIISATQRQRVMNWVLIAFAVIATVVIIAIPMLRLGRH
jgi:hypothetical protein